MKKVLKKLAQYIPDKLYLKLFYRYATGNKLNLKNPQTFNEKLQWLKLYDRNPLYTKLVDKYEVREYIKEKIGEEYLIPLLGVWDNVDEINFDELPSQFVLKTTHDSGGVVICKDKRNFDIDQAKNFLSEHLQNNFYYMGREWPYKNVKPRIIAEKYMVDESNIELKDYKLFCFDGNVVLIQVDYGRFEKHMRNLYDLDWNYLDLEIQYPTNSLKVINKPNNLCEMLDIASSLSRKLPHVRVDMYVINNKVYFGELTFYHGSGTEKITPKKWDYKLGDMINLDLAYSKVGSKNENFNR